MEVNGGRKMKDNIIKFPTISTQEATKTITMAGLIETDLFDLAIYEFEKRIGGISIGDIENGIQKQ